MPERDRSGVSRRELARQIGVTEGAVRKAIRSGRITAQPNGRLDPERARRDWIANTQKNSPTRGIDPPPATGAPSGSLPSYATSRAAREHFEARISQMKALEIAGKLLRREDVERSAHRLYSAVRDRLLAVPDRLDVLVAACSDAAQCHSMIREELVNALTELSDDPTGGIA